MSASKIQDETLANTSASKITSGRYSRNEERLNLAKKSGARVKNMRKASTAALSESDPQEIEDNNEVAVAMSSLAIHESHEGTSATNNNEVKDGNGAVDQINTTIDGVTNISSKRSSKKRSLDEISNDDPCDQPLCEQSSKRKRNFDDMKQELGEQFLLNSERIRSEQGSKPRESHSKFFADAPVQSFSEKLDHCDQASFEEKPEHMIAPDTSFGIQEIGVPQFENEEGKEAQFEQQQEETKANHFNIPQEHDSPFVNYDLQNQNQQFAHEEIHDLQDDKKVSQEGVQDQKMDLNEAQAEVDNQNVSNCKMKQQVPQAEENPAEIVNQQYLTFNYLYREESVCGVVNETNENNQQEV